MLGPVGVFAPNDTAMYIELVYTYSICSDWSVIESSLSAIVVLSTRCLIAQPVSRGGDLRESAGGEAATGVSSAWGRQPALA